MHVPGSHAQAPEWKCAQFVSCVLWADLHTRPATLAAQREAFDTLTEAERLFGASCVLAHEKRALATARSPRFEKVTNRIAGSLLIGAETPAA